MVMLLIAYLSIWSHQGHVRYLRESKSYLFYIHATSKNEVHICSNKHETGLVHHSIRTKLLLHNHRAYILNRKSSMCDIFKGVEVETKREACRAFYCIFTTSLIN